MKAMVVENEKELQKLDDVVEMLENIETDIEEYLIGLKVFVGRISDDENNIPGGKNEWQLYPTGREFDI